MTTVATPYKPVTGPVLRELTAIFGKERISTAPEDVLTYAYDATRKEYPPQAVVWPESAEEIAELFRVATREHFPVYPRGGGSGLTGGALALEGGIQLSTERMNQVLELDEANRLVHAQSGIMLGDLKTRVQEKGLFYPPDPSSAKTASLGGTLANCAGGLNCVKYGTTKDWVQSVKAVTASGDIITAGSKARKNVVGYNLLQLLIGCEGTLGVITEATLRLLPYPTRRKAFIALYSSVRDALASVRSMLDSGIVPSAIEFIDRNCLEAANSYVKDKEMPVADALLLVEQDGFEDAPLEKDLSVLMNICREGNATEVRGAHDEQERLALWSVRKSLSPAMYTIATFKTNEDICVPLSEIESTLDVAYELGSRYNIPTLCFGHAGDGNIHVNYMSSKENDPDVEAAVKALMIEVVKRGGSISGEHGIGISKAPYLSLEIGDTERKIMQSIKQFFDPSGILNPGKIFTQS